MFENAIKNMKLALLVSVISPVAALLAAPATSYAPTVKKAAPAVVFLVSHGHLTSDLSEIFPSNDPLNQLYDSANFAESMPIFGQGSGVIISEEGYILTNHHVIKGGSNYGVLLADGRLFDARFIASDPASDLGIVQLIQPHNLPVAVMGDSNVVEVGDVVLAIGSPLSLKHSVSMGIVSGLSRNNLGVLLYEDYIQTDATLNHGNSGGALVNIDGEVIGINTLSAGPGLGFAISINHAKRIFEDLLSYGEVARGWIGVLMLDLDPTIRSHFEYAGPGVLLQAVYSQSPAEKAGLRPGDIVVSINGNAIKNSGELRNITASCKEGETVKVRVWRKSQSIDLHLIIEKRPANGL